jgi:hypothetical protein
MANAKPSVAVMPTKAMSSHDKFEITFQGNGLYQIVFYHMGGYKASDVSYTKTLWGAKRRVRRVIRLTRKYSKIKPA